MALFQLGNFTLHSGKRSSWKVDCDALTDRDWQALAFIISRQVKFSSVIGVPRGGLKLASNLNKYCQLGYPTLIVDDVLTTGASMEEVKKQIAGDAIGYVVFARGKCPDWIKALWYSSKPGMRRVRRGK